MLQTALQTQDQLAGLGHGAVKSTMDHFCSPETTATSVFLSELRGMKGRASLVNYLKFVHIFNILVVKCLYSYYTDYFMPFFSVNSCEWLRKVSVR